MIRGYILLAENDFEKNQFELCVETSGQSKASSAKLGFRGHEAEANVWYALGNHKLNNESLAIEAAESAIGFFDSQAVDHPMRGVLDRVLSELTK